MSSFKMHSHKDLETNNFQEPHLYTMSHTPVTVITNKSDDFGDDITISVNGKNVIIHANTTKLHHT